MEKLTTKQFLIKLLNGMALGIVVALIPNAVLSALLKPFSHIEIIRILIESLVIMQGLVGAIIGILVGLQFGINPMKSTIIGSASLIASGVIRTISVGDKTFFVMRGTGDLINVMIFTAIAVLVTLWLGEKCGSVTIVIQPIIGALIGFVGLLCLPYVSQITAYIGSLITTFTTLQPLFMSLFITISFAILIISPISTVAIGLATGLIGLSAGAANMGVTVGAAVLVVGSIYAKNKSGVTLAVLLGAMKMMLPNIAKNPIMYLPLTITAAVSAIGVRFLGIEGIPQTAGFGIVGLIGPLKAYQILAEKAASFPLIKVIIAYLIIPFTTALLVHILFTKVFKIYSDEIYKFES